MSNESLTILLARDAIPPGLLAKIRALSPRIEIIYSDELPDHAELLERVEVSFGNIPRELWTRARRLRWMQMMGAGVDGVLTAEVKAHPVVITNAHLHAEPIAEQLFGMLLMLVRRLHEAYRLQQEQHWGGIRELEVLPGKTLGLVGVGTIGRRTAEIANAFGLHVLGMRQSSAPAPHVDEMFSPTGKADMFPRCDYLMLTIPLTPQTHHFIGATELALLPPHACLFNIGRGKVVDTDALVAALREGRLAGAGLDVTDPEPLPAGHPLWTLPNVIITPHNAGLHPNYAEHAGRLFLDNLRRYLTGDPLVNVVDKDEGY
jgi:phosphoglycerate dehydrogenase-like enzyme